MLEGPEDFGRGVINGSWALTRSLFGAPSKAFSQATGSLGRTVAHLSMDDAYLRSRQERENPKHAVDGLVSGSVGLATGVVEGLTGLISAPLEGAHTHGLKGFVKGVGKGLVGVAVKPAAGVFDLASRTAEGVAKTFDFFEQRIDDPSRSKSAAALMRLRPPRMLHGAERAVRPYSRFEGHAHLVLLGLREGVHLSEELLLCLQLTGTDLLVLTVRTHRTPRAPLAAATPRALVSDGPPSARVCHLAQVPPPLPAHRRRVGRRGRRRDDAHARAQTERRGECTPRRDPERGLCALTRGMRARWPRGSAFARSRRGAERTRSLDAPSPKKKRPTLSPRLRAPPNVVGPEAPAAGARRKGLARQRAAARKPRLHRGSALP